MYVRFACLYIYEHVYCCHSEMGTCMSGLRVSISTSMCTVVTVRWARVCHGLRVSISMSMCTAATARWARVCPVCVSLYI